MGFGQATELKALGNEAFRAKNAPEAIHAFTRAMNALPPAFSVAINPDIVVPSTDNNDDNNNNNNNKTSSSSSSSSSSSPSTTLSESDELRSVLYSNRSAAWSLASAWIPALRDADAAVAIRPNWPKAHGRRGAALLGSGKVAAALAAFETALEHDPSDNGLRQEYNSVATMLKTAHGGKQDAANAAVRTARESFPPADHSTAPHLAALATISALSSLPPLTKPDLAAFDVSSPQELASESSGPISALATALKTKSKLNALVGGLDGRQTLLGAMMDVGLGRTNIPFTRQTRLDAFAIGLACTREEGGRAPAESVPAMKALLKLGSPPENPTDEADWDLGEAALKIAANALLGSHLSTVVRLFQSPAVGGVQWCQNCYEYLAQTTLRPPGEDGSLSVGDTHDAKTTPMSWLRMVNRVTLLGISREAKDHRKLRADGWLEFLLPLIIVLTDAVIAAPVEARSRPRQGMLAATEEALKLWFTITMDLGALDPEPTEANEAEVEAMSDLQPALRKILALEPKGNAGTEALMSAVVSCSLNFPEVLARPLIEERGSLERFYEHLTYKLKLPETEHAPQDNLTAVCLGLTAFAKATDKHVGWLRERLLPPPMTGLQEPEEEGKAVDIGAVAAGRGKSWSDRTTSEKLVSLLTSPSFGFTNVLSNLLFTLAGEDPEEYIAYVGLGNAAGLLANRGLLAGETKTYDIPDDAPEPEMDPALGPPPDLSGYKGGPIGSTPLPDLPQVDNRPDAEKAADKGKEAAVKAKQPEKPLGKPTGQKTREGFDILEGETEDDAREREAASLMEKFNRLNELGIIKVQTEVNAGGPNMFPKDGSIEDGKKPKE